MSYMDLKDEQLGLESIIKVNENIPLEKMEGILERLKTDSNLHKLLSEEKMRCELHKCNYEKLKSEYLKVLHQNQQVSSALAQVEQDQFKVQEASIQTNQQAQEQIQKLTNEINHLQTLIPTSADHLDLEEKIIRESESKWKERIQMAIEDVEASKLTIHNLLQDNLYLKMTLKQTLADSEQNIEEINLRNANKISKLEAINEELRNFHEPKVDSLQDELNQLSHENIKLRSKIKFLDQNNDENSSRIRSLEAELINNCEKTSKTEAILNSTIAKLEAEKMDTEKMMEKVSSEATSLRLNLQEVKAENNLLQDDLTTSKAKHFDLENSHAFNMNSLKLEMAKEKSSLQTEINHLQNQLKESENEIAKKSLECIRIREDKDFQSHRIEDGMMMRISKLETNVSELEMENQGLRTSLMKANEFIEQQRSGFNSDTMKTIKQLQDNLRVERQRCQHLEQGFDTTKSSEKSLDVSVQTESNNLEECENCMLLMRKYQTLQMKHKKFSQMLRKEPPLLNSPIKKL